MCLSGVSPSASAASLALSIAQGFEREPDGGRRLGPTRCGAPLDLLDLRLEIADELLVAASDARPGLIRGSRRRSSLCHGLKGARGMPGARGRRGLASILRSCTGERTASAPQESAALSAASRILLANASSQAG
jgi:hypothetical protein